MLEIAEGRKAIMNLIGASWRTIQRRKKKDDGFRRLFMQNPITHKPIMIVSEYFNYLITWNNTKQTEN